MTIWNVRKVQSYFTWTEAAVSATQVTLKGSQKTSVPADDPEPTESGVEGRGAGGGGARDR